jgi:N-acetylglucosaminyl-diphospho-decaprenol L-rhamnosyltransferase
MKRLGVVVVTYNSEAVIGRCLASLARTDASVVVVDNASRDGTREEVLRNQGVTLIANPWNRGFAAAVNQGIGALDTSYVLLLNPDAEVAGGLDALLAACGEPGTAAAGGKLVDERGRPQTGFMVRRFPSAASLSLEALGVNRVWPGNPVNRRYRCADLDPESPFVVDQPAGAFLMIRRDVWRSLGGFDERFEPLWFDDVDFCKRVADAGYRARYVPSAIAAHGGGHSASQLQIQAREAFWYGNLLRYAAKHFRPQAFLVVCAAVMLGSCFRTIWGIIRFGSLKPISVYRGIFRLAAAFLTPGRHENLRLSSVLSGR